MAGTVELDGRRQRAADSRARIVRAMLKLIAEGDVTPGAEQVAARAEVGLRTVFRHFKDMDSLYREMAEVMEREIRKGAALPLTSPDWKGKLAEFVDRRSFAFERLGPFKQAQDVHRHRSEALARNSARLAEELRTVLKREMPPEVVSDVTLFESLDLLLSFEAWSRLRRDQGLGIDEAKAVLKSALAKIAG